MRAAPSAGALCTPSRLSRPSLSLSLASAHSASLSLFAPIGRRLASKEELARNASGDNAQLQAKMEELTADAGRKERALTQSRQQALEEKQKGLEYEQSCKWLGEDKQRLEKLLEKREKESAELAERATTAEATVKMLTAKLDSLGAKDMEASLEMRPLKEVQKQAGVFDPLAQLPNVPVLKSLVDTIDSAQKDISAIATTDIPTMAKIEVLNVDQSLPPDEGELYSREPVPLPKEKVMLRQFDNSHLYEGEGAPSSEDGLEGGAAKREATNTGKRASGKQIKKLAARTPEWHSVREKKAAREGAASSMCQGRGRDRPRRGCRHGARAKTEALRGDATPFSMSLSAPLGPATRGIKGCAASRCRSPQI